MANSPTQDGKTQWTGCLYFADRSSTGQNIWYFLIRQTTAVGISLYRQHDPIPVLTDDMPLQILACLTNNRINKHIDESRVRIETIHTIWPGIKKYSPKLRETINQHLTIIRTCIGDTKIDTGWRMLRSFRGGERRELLFFPEVHHCATANLATLAEKGLRLQGGNGEDDEPVDPGSLLQFKAWAAGRYDRWLEEPPVATKDFRRLRRAMLEHEERSRPWHGMLQGEIASGKSTTTYQFLRWAYDSGRFRRILVLPLGADFAVPNSLLEYQDWSRREAVRGFVATLDAVPDLMRAKTLIVVEDAHETGVLESLPWTHQGKDRANLDLTAFSLLFTCRLQYAPRLAEALSTMCSLIPERYECAPEVTAVSLARATVKHDQVSFEQAMRLFRHAGQNLVVLSIALRQWIKRGRKGTIKMRLVHEAVMSELKTVSDHLKGSSRLNSRTLALVWLMGALDLPADVGILANYFGLEPNLHRFWKALQRVNEVSPGDTVNKVPQRYIGRRHPAWGQLVMHVLDDEFERSGRHSAISTDIVNRFLESPVVAANLDLFVQDGRRPKPSICILFSILHAERPLIDDSDREDSNEAEVSYKAYESFFQSMAFQCSGRFIFDEFITASALVTELDRRSGVDEIRLCTRQIAIAGVARRTAPVPWSADQSYTNRTLAHEELKKAINVLQSEFGPRLDGYERQGAALYEDAYYDGWFGRFENAASKLKLSIESEEARGDERFPFAEMSRVQLSKVRVDQGRFEEGLNIAQLALKRLKSFSGSNKEAESLARFRGNAEHAIGEALLCLRRTGDAEAAFLSAAKEFGSAKLAVDDSLTNARVAIARKDPTTARHYCRQFRTDLVNMKSGESWEEYYRIVGDCHFLAHQMEKASDAYKRIIPVRQLEDATLQVELSPEGLIAQSRLEAIQRGLSSDVVFEAGPI